MGALLVPAMIGAGIGAAGGLITKQNPFKTALTVPLNMSLLFDNNII